MAPSATLWLSAAVLLAGASIAAALARDADDGAPAPPDTVGLGLRRRKTMKVPALV